MHLERIKESEEKPLFISLVDENNLKRDYDQ
jgi:hypothetical protein